VPVAHFCVAMSSRQQETQSASDMAANDKWDKSVSELTEFVADLASDEIGAGRIGAVLPAGPKSHL
jgi:hypothetical protein